MQHEFRKFRDFKWDNVKMINYKPENGPTTFFNVTRQNIVEANEEIGFDVRYFECGPGGYTTLEKHSHVHVVMALRGQGNIIVGQEIIEAKPFDLVIINAWTPHQLINTGNEPFGFICSVNGQRDKFQLLKKDEIDELERDNKFKETVRIPDKYFE